MSRKLGPLEIVCDSPPYPIVVACVGFVENPLDSRWENIDRLVEELREKTKKKITALGNCPLCNHKLESTKGWRFTYSSGDEVTYLIVQCDRCHTVFWKEKVE